MTRLLLARRANEQIKLVDGKLPERLVVLPAGTVLPDGRRMLELRPGDPRPPLFIGKGGHRKIIAAFKANKRPLVLDVNHNTERTFMPGDQAARAQIDDLKIRDDGAVDGAARWTKLGREELEVADGEAPLYAFFSPVVRFEETGSGREIVAVESLALTNNPALEDSPVMTGLARTNMNTATLTALALEPSATDAEISAKITKLTRDLERLRTDLDNARAALGVDDLSPKALAELASRPTVAEHNLLKARVSEMETAAEDSERAALFEKAAADGRLTPAMRAKIEKMSLDLDTLGTMLDLLPPQIEDLAKPPAPATGIGETNEVEIGNDTYKLTDSEHRIWLRSGVDIADRTHPKHIIAARPEQGRARRRHDMTALTKDSSPLMASDTSRVFTVADATTIFFGAMVMLSASGELVPASSLVADADAGLVVGVAHRQVSATDTDRLCPVHGMGDETFRVLLDTGPTISDALIGSPVFVVDDATVGLHPATPATANNPVLAGVITSIDTERPRGVFVRPIAGGSSPVDVETQTIATLDGATDTIIGAVPFITAGRVLAAAVSTHAALAAGDLVIALRQTSGELLKITVPQATAAGTLIVADITKATANTEIGARDNVLVQIDATNANTATINGTLTTWVYRR